MNSSEQDPEPNAVREGRELLEAYYFPDSEYGRAVEFRENATRLIVFDIHLAIEDLLKFFLHGRIAQDSVLDDTGNIAYVKRLKSHQAIDLAARLGVIDRELHGDLIELNAVRNRAGHTWALDEPEMGPSGQGRASFRSGGRGED